MSSEPNLPSSDGDVHRHTSTARRSFLGMLIGLIWASITGTIAVIAARFVVPPLSSTGAAQWTDVGLLKDIPEGKAVKRNVIVSQDSGWARFNSERSVWVVRTGSNVTVFSTVCPHLGCTVDLSANGFACLCHGSIWNIRGEKLGGPTPRALDALESRIEGEQIKVRYQDFKQGVPEKQPIV
jgi:quinol---cytochrome c reductase iron-sulfur subunit, bacillus type